MCAFRTRHFADQLGNMPQTDLYLPWKSKGRNKCLPLESYVSLCWLALH